MSKIKYRPTIARFIDEMTGDLPSEWFKLNIKQIAKQAGVSRGTIYNWLSADTDDPEQWFTGYDGHIERQLKEVFSEIAGREIEVIEAVEVDEKSDTEGQTPRSDDMIDVNRKSLPRFGEASILAASAAF